MVFLLTKMLTLLIICSCLLQKEINEGLHKPRPSTTSRAAGLYSILKDYTLLGMKSIQPILIVYRKTMLKMMIILMLKVLAVDVIKLNLMILIPTNW